MSEETAGVDPASEGPGAGVDPVAAAFALGGASQAQVDAFLKKQEAFIDDQRHHLHEQLKNLRLVIWQNRMGLLLRVSTALVGIALAAAFGLLVWQALNSSDLVMEPFSVPADLAQTGMTGEVMASDLSGRISDMLTRFSSFRAQQSYANNFGAGLKIEIPETGVSLSELDRFLRERLGHDVHITGAVIHTKIGLKLTLHAGELGNASVEGPESDLDQMQQRLAEALFGITQPYRFGVFLDQSGRTNEGRVIFQRLINGNSIRERAWGYVGLGNAAPFVAPPGDADKGARDLYLHALETDSQNGLAMSNLGKGEMRIYPEQALIHARKFLSALARPDRYQIDPDLIGTIRLQATEAVDQVLGAFHEAAQKVTDPEFTRKPYVGQSADIAAAQRGSHDLRAAQATIDGAVPTSPRDAFQIESERLQIFFSFADWTGVVGRLPVLEDFLKHNSNLRFQYHLDTEPYVAIANAMLGDLTNAERRVADTPEDCYPCLIARARVAELKGDHGQADLWFARAVETAPSVPFAAKEWGLALLGRNQPDDAIAKFRLANQKGPRFADPLEGWGEALMAQNRSDLALAKFEEANKYAPNWGRLHLKWGEALRYAGNKEEAQKQFTLAGTLDLTPDEKAELGNASRG